MPSALVKRISRLSGRTIGELEDLWKQAKEIAVSKNFIDGTDNFYKYATGVFKKSLGKDKIYVGVKND